MPVQGGRKRSRHGGKHRRSRRHSAKPADAPQMGGKMWAGGKRRRSRSRRSRKSKGGSRRK